MAGQRSRAVYRHVITMKRLVSALFRESAGGLHDALWGGVTVPERYRHADERRLVN